eukprot:scaffold41617_cov75-Cyclotella_meneghiniana.AAC.5
MSSSSYYKADSAKDIQEIIETEANITPIRGHPDCHTLIQLLNQLCKGAKEVSCDYSAYGLMWLCLPQPIYFALTRENVVTPMQPPQTPPYDPQGSATKNALITIQWQKNKELWDQMQNANKALINAAKGALNEESRDALTNLFVGTADRENLILETHQFSREYEEWRKIPDADRTWAGPTHSTYGLKHPELHPPWDSEATLKKSPKKRKLSLTASTSSVQPTNKLRTNSKASINTKVTADEEDAEDEDAVEDTRAVEEAEELDRVSTISKEDIKGNQEILTKPQQAEDSTMDRTACPTQSSITRIGGIVGAMDTMWTTTALTVPTPEPATSVMRRETIHETDA